MSSLQIYKIGRDGDVHHHEDCRNSWGGAIHIWNTYATQLGVIQSLMDAGRLLMNGYEEVWQRTDELPEGDQWVMRSTFDRVIIRAEDIPIFVCHLNRFIERYPTRTLVELSMTLTALVRDEPIRGVCFNQTSVNSNPWQVYDGANIDEWGDDEGRPYNIDRDTNHWWLHAPDKPLPTRATPEES